MPVLYTIGYEKRSLAAFIARLRTAGVDVVIDIRLRNTSQLAGYTKRDDLAFLLREGFGIAYEHHPELAPSAEILDAYRQDHDWAAYERQFTALLHERRAEAVGRVILDRYRTPCLLCHGTCAEHCHRRLVAESWSARLPGLTVTDL